MPSSSLSSLKAALVTGASKRLGRAMALALAKEGWDIAIHYHHSREEAETLVADIQKSGRRAFAFQADLSQEAATAALIPAINKTMGPITALVNNASLFKMDLAKTATRESWNQHLETNLRAPFVLSQYFAEQLPEGQTGNIVNMLDQRVWKLTPYFVSYTVAKSGLWTLTRTLALSYAPKIRVNAIGPGPTLPSPRQSEEQFQNQFKSMPLGRGTTPEEIADCLLFLLNAPAVTGQMIALDGGEHLGWQVPGRHAGSDIIE